ncbi:MAG TPA: tripartite tricarboxylate transporter substrate binding protein [Burkholderiales bacterium]|nr:tripartite tricarboxylate transporter substrate binding protein [Burkholderiales bacterium]
MPILRLTIRMLLIAVMFPGGTALAQEFPARLIRIVTSPPGGNNDFTARLMMKGLTEKAGWQMVIDNRAILVAYEVVARSAPDGYTLLVAGGTFISGNLFEKLSFDPLRDFTAISITHRAPNILVVHPSVPAKSVKELIAFAKARPGELNYGSSGIGSSNHLAAELFNVMAGVKTVRINYKGVGPAVNALLSGETHLMIVNVPAVAGYIQSGRLRQLAITSTEPSPLRPGLPTMAAAGLPGFESIVLSGTFAPAGTPAPVVIRLNQEIVRAINQPDIKEKFLALGIETVGSSPQEATAAVKSEIAKVGKLIKDAGIRTQ